MDKTIKRIMLLLFVLLLIYIQQATVIYAESAGEEHRAAEEGEEGKGEEGEGEKEPEKPRPEIKSFLTWFSEPDGKEGIYRTKPGVRIRHVSERGITRYQLARGTQVLTQGLLEQEGQEVFLTGESFGEGKHQLNVWMEDEEGQPVEEFVLQETFWVDTQVPDIKMEVKGGFEAWHRGEVTLNVEADDKVSGVRRLVCYTNGEYAGEAKEGKGTFVIKEPSLGGKEVEVKIVAEDRAGNQCSRVKSLYIDSKAPCAEISGVEDYMITGRPLSVIYEVQEENILSECEAFAEWENVQGIQTVLAVPEWESTKDGKRTVQRLTEDGIYRLKISAADKAGHKVDKSMQVIIDKENPVIRYVDQLEGQYLKSFCWDYPEGEVIWDFTTYASEVRLDGALYPMGKKIRAEGKHVLEVQAKDAAGNQAQARAEFVVDHTPPKIIFKDVEEGKEYEEKQTIQVELGSPEDTIEGIQINGKKQKIHAGSKAFQCTVQEHQDYEVKVSAADKAGNRSEKSLMFTVVPKKTFFQKITQPAAKAFTTGNRVKRREDMDQKGEREQTSQMPVAAAPTAAAALITAAWYFRRRRKHSAVEGD